MTPNEKEWSQLLTPEQKRHLNTLRPDEMPKFLREVEAGREAREEQLWLDATKRFLKDNPNYRGGEEDANVLQHILLAQGLVDAEDKYGAIVYAVTFAKANNLLTGK